MRLINEQQEKIERNGKRKAPERRFWLISTYFAGLDRKRSKSLRLMEEERVCFAGCPIVEVCSRQQVSSEISFVKDVCIQESWEQLVVHRDY